jgi:hypothetical protein
LLAAKMCVVNASVLFSLVLTNQAALACSCVGPRGLNILSNNAAVFAGKVMAVEYLTSGANSSEPPIRVTFDVKEVWKGPVRSTIILTTIYNRFSCEGYFFNEGQHYLVAAKSLTRDDGKSGIAELEGIFLCGGTSVLSEANANLKLLGSGRLPE